jgi:hypothetical protein
MQNSMSHIRSRHLLSDYDDPEDDNKENQPIETKNQYTNDRLKDNSKNYNGSNNLVNDTNLELVFINGTWHMVDLNICYKILSVNETTGRFYNHSHSNKINNELNTWFERHVDGLKSMRNHDKGYEHYASSIWREFIRQKHKKFNTISESENNKRLRFKDRRQMRDEVKLEQAKDYPVSVYDTQSRLYENFARTVRTRDDTFYYVSFRRDHVIYPAIKQNKTQRPKVSLIVPVLIQVATSANNNTGSSSNDNNNSNRQVQFMQIDCEVTDTRLFTMNYDQLPHDYLKILNQDESHFNRS